MELRNLQIIPLSHYTDELMNVTYLKVLTSEAIESVRLPAVIKNYRLQHLIRPNFLLEVELVRTKKNWILKNVLSHLEFVELENYVDHLRFSEIISLLGKYSYDGQEVKIMDFLVRTFQENTMTELDITAFESRLLERLGFAPRLPEEDLPIRLHWAKASSGLV